MTDEGAFGEFYRTNYRSVVAQLYAYTGDLTEAQESAQEAFIRAWTRWQKVADYDEPRAWVCRVAYRVAVSRWRRAKTAAASWRRHGPPHPGPEPDGINADLVAALRQLPEAQRRALVLHYLGGFSVAEIATLDGVASGTVRSRLSRGRDALAELLASEDGYGTGRGPRRRPGEPPPDEDLAPEGLRRQIVQASAAGTASVQTTVDSPPPDRPDLNRWEVCASA